MNVLLINTYDWGGAGTATARIHRGLRELGVDSRMLVRHKRRNDPYVIGPRGPFRRVYDLSRIVLDRVPLLPFGKVTGDFSLGWMPDDLPRRIRALDPDLVQLNWVGEGGISVRSLGRLDRPIVWRLPDMWAFTGGCHYADGCRRFERCCGSCPKLSRHIGHDPSWWTHRSKRRAWKDVEITVVAPSTWLASKARSSSLFAERRIDVIPNGLDTTVFKSYDTGLARDVFQLPPKGPIVLFGSVSPTSDTRKGFDYLRNALLTLREGDLDGSIRVVIFGTHEPEDPTDLGFDVTYTGYLHDDRSLALLYSAADVMVVPSKYEGFGQTASEALSCGTPVVAFDATGPSDIVDHRETGYLAEPYDPTDLAAGIEWIIEDRDRRDELGSAAREKAVTEFDHEIIAGRYRDLYREVLA